MIIKKILKFFLNWQVALAIVFLFLSFLGYLVHYLIFRDLHHIFLYLVGDIAFIFVELLFVAIIFHRLLELRDKKNILKKLNMVIGTFYSEVGQVLLRNISSFDKNSEIIAKQLEVKEDWNKKEFFSISKKLKKYDCQIDPKRADLEELKKILIEKRQFLLGLLENQNLLEHESFTNLLWAVFHLAEELTARKNLKSLTENDAKHLANDIKRAYLLVIQEWLSYMSHLKVDYPYLFSFAIRTNPFNDKASVEIK